MSGDVERLYERARELPREARDAFVDEACRGDPALRDELGSLLAHADAAERFFDRLGGAVRAAVPALERDAARHFVSDDPPVASSDSSVSSPPELLVERDPMLGRTIGRYRVLALLGRGGMGTVYRAHDERLDREVALKFLPPQVTEESDATERFLVEARAAAALTHPNVCTVHEIGETGDGRPFIAMALYEGETLRQRLRRGPLPPREAATIARDVARALGAAHARGIVHRDVKPGNVMLARDGMAKLLDFGLAQVGDPSRAGAGAVACGTIAYMSPEQARGRAIDHRSDLWSLGVVLHEMLAGSRPFGGGADVVVLHAIAHEPAEPLASRDPAVPLALRRIVERLLRKPREERYPDAASVEADLTAALATSLDPSDERETPSAAIDGATPAQAPATRPAPAGRRAGRRRLAAAAIGVAMAAAATATFPRRAAAPVPAGLAAAAPAARSLAVLPFVDLSGGRAERYFGDGLSEQITTALGRIEGLRVAARTSAFALRDRALDVRRIGDTLGVDAVLEGSVRRAGHRLRVTTQLVDAHSGMRIWAGAYDREDADVLTVQDEIAGAIADALELRLRLHEGTPHVRSTTNPEAYDLYLRALQLRTDLSADGLQRATDLLDRAIELQPDFALAYAAKASVLEPRVLFRQIPQAEGLRAARAAIDRAFALDPRNGEAHVALGILQLFWEWDWAGAERSLRRAVALDPNNAHAWHHLGNYYRAMGRLDHAADARLRGLALDPLNARLRGALGEEYFYAGRWDDALAALQRAAQLDPLHPILLGRANAAVGPGRVYIAQGREADGVRDLLRVAALRGASADEIDALRAAYRRGGIHGFWRTWLEMDRRQSGPSMDPLRIAALSALAGDSAQALTALERAYAERNPGLIFVRTDPAFGTLHTNPRYLRVVRAMRFPER